MTEDNRRLLWRIVVDLLVIAVAVWLVYMKESQDERRQQVRGEHQSGYFHTQ